MTFETERLERVNQEHHGSGAWFCSLEAVHPAELIGLWKGVGIASGHPLDGVLENLDWFGKRFHSDMRADALLFRSSPARLVAVEPGFIPLRMALRFASFGRTFVARNWFTYLRRAIRAKGTTAQLRLDGGAEPTAVMVYDRQPITDHFRKIGEDEVAGMMVVEGDARRYFFKLTKAEMT